jgi:hypothetical protein
MEQVTAMGMERLQVGCTVFNADTLEAVIRRNLAGVVALTLQPAEAMLEAYAQNWRYCEQGCTCWWCELRSAVEEAKNAKCD